MIDQFETALADLIADRIGTVPSVQVVTQWRDGLDALEGDSARIAVQVFSGDLTNTLGDDRDEELRAAGDVRLRTTVRLAGQVRITVQIGTASGAAERLAQRGALLDALDRLLLALHDQAVRTGEAFGDDQAQGFAIDRFRQLRIEHPEGVAGESTPAQPEYRRIDLWCEYTGRFWPVEAPATGDLIVEPVRIRMVTLDAVLPGPRSAQAGDPDVTLPVTIDLSTLGGAEPRLVARLTGAAPPGELIGSTTNTPAGSVSYLPESDGRYDVAFRPAAVVTGTSIARIVLSLASHDQPTVRVGELSIEVTG